MTDRAIRQPCPRHPARDANAHPSGCPECGYRYCIICDSFHRTEDPHISLTVPGMTPGQEAHLAAVKAEFNAAVDTKYRAGQREHGGNLYDVEIDTLIDAAIDEAVDQFVYLVTLKNRRKAQTGA